MTVSYLNSAFGTIALHEENDAITRIYFLPEGSTPPLEPLPRKCNKSPLLAETEQALNEYFAGLRTSFDLPLAPKGTLFQHAVWDALLDIPYGETRSYAQIATQIGQPNAARAVGGACQRNPILLLIPCHRVVGANGKRTGYAGGAETKEYLLEHEATYA